MIRDRADGLVSLNAGSDQLAHKFSGRKLNDLGFQLGYTVFQGQDERQKQQANDCWYEYP